jgi:regulator of replication initiation timing
MQLLSPEKIGAEKKASAEEARLRVSSLGKEESDLVLSLNLGRQEIAEIGDEKARGELALAAFRESLEPHRQAILADIVRLEDQRAELLKPIDEIKREADATLANAQQVLLSNEEITKTLEEQKLGLDARDAATAEAERALDARKAHLDLRETGIQAQELATAQKATSLDKAKLDHAAVVAEDDRRASDRSRDLAARELHVEQERDRQTKKDQEQRDHDRVIEMRYGALERATRLTSQNNG